MDKWGYNYLIEWKTLREKEKLLVRSNFIFSHDVFKNCLLRQNEYLWSKRLIENFSNVISECSSTVQPISVCEPPPVPDNGNFVLSNYNQTVTFTCNLGYILSGSSVRICNTDGSRWSGIQPSCGKPVREKRTCKDLFVFIFF